MAKGVTKQSVDFSKWYNDVVKLAQLADHGPVKGTMVMRPYGYAIWELLQKELDQRFKATGHVNAYFPTFIPQSFLEKEAEHVEGFAPEVAVVTHGGGKKLEEPLIVRPTSETIIWHMYKKWISSYRDLPLLINQWANVFRWEMRPRLFIRTTEFLWQEGHTAHATAQEAEDETLKMLEVYREFSENILGMPVITGQKSENEKFAGAVSTYSIEAMMRDGKALQAGTSHYLGQNFAKAFEVTFQNSENNPEFVYATSWGVSTRLIGGVIMTHGDDKGLILPPKLAPFQIVFVPIFKTDEQKEAVMSKVNVISDILVQQGVRVKIDDDETKSPGFKFNEWEMRGVPMRVEIGPRDIDENHAKVVTRYNGEKEFISLDSLSDALVAKLDTIQQNLFNRALEYRKAHTTEVETWDEFKKVLKEKGGFIKAYWDGTSETENRIKDATKASIRNIPFGSEVTKGVCVFSGKPAKYKVVFAKAY